MRRYYHPNGKSCPLWFMRLALTMAFVPMMIFYISIALFDQIRSALSFVWIEAKGVVSDFRRHWSGNP